MHGGLLRAELDLLSYAFQGQEDDMLFQVETAIGPLFLPKRVRHGLSTEAGESTPGRTANASIDGAYIRLFIRRTPGQWTINNPKALGRVTTDTSELPTVTLDGQLYYVCGKALGNGMTARNLRRHLDTAASTLAREQRKLLVVGPDTSRYQSITKAFAHVVAFSQYTLEQAVADNLSSAGGINRESVKSPR